MSKNNSTKRLSWWLRPQDILYTLTRPLTREPIGLEVWMRIGAEYSNLNEGWLRFKPVTSCHDGFWYHIKLDWTYCECQQLSGKTRGAHTSQAKECISSQNHMANHMAMGRRSPIAYKVCTPSFNLLMLDKPSQHPLTCESSLG